MQEQHPYKMTPEHGWGQMKPILDKEMPTTSKSRRFLLFWWAAAAIFTSSIIAAFSLIQSHEIISSTPAVTDASSIQHDQQSNQTGIAEQNTSSQLKENEELANGNSLISSTLNSTTNNSTYEKMTGTISNGLVSKGSVNKNDLPAFAIIENHHTNTDVLETDAAFLIQESGSNEILNTGHVDHTNVIASNDSRVNASIIPMIDYLEAGELETQSLSIGTVYPAKNSKFKRANNLLTPHLTVGVLKEFQSGLGAHGGVGLDINISPRLSLTADMGYSVHKPDVVLFGGLAADKVFEESHQILRNDLAYEGIGDYLPVEVVNTASSQVIGQFVQTVKQWQVSAGIQYDLSRRFFVQAGATYGFGTTARTTYPIVSNDIDNIPTTGNAITVKNSFNTYDVLKNTTSVTAGMGYRISPKTEVYAQWSHGLNPYLEGKGETPLTGEFSSEGEKQDNHIRGINMGLRHSL